MEGPVDALTSVGACPQAIFHSHGTRLAPRPWGGRVSLPMPSTRLVSHGGTPRSKSRLTIRTPSCPRTWRFGTSGNTLTTASGSTASCLAMPALCRAGTTSTARRRSRRPPRSSRPAAEEESRGFLARLLPRASSSHAGCRRDREARPPASPRGVTESHARRGRLQTPRIHNAHKWEVGLAGRVLSGRLQEPSDRVDTHHIIYVCIALGWERCDPEAVLVPLCAHSARPRGGRGRSLCLVRLYHNTVV